MPEVKVLNLQEAANYCGYRDKRKFYRNWVVPNKVPFELRGNKKFFLKEILEKWLVKIAEATARSVYEKPKDNK